MPPTSEPSPQPAAGHGPAVPGHLASSGSRLANPNAAWAHDDGRPDPALRQALAAAGSRDGYLDAVVALGGARLVVPIVAEGDDGGRVPDPTREAELSAVTIVAPDGTRALPVFSGLDALQAWAPRGRPVLGTLDEVCRTAAELDAHVVVVDPAGPSPLELGADLVARFAAGHRLVRLPDGGLGWASASA